MNKAALVFGGQGLVGSRFCQLSNKHLQIIAPDITEIDITDYSVLKEFINRTKAKVIINFAAFTDVDGAEKELGDEKEMVFKVNAIGPKNLANICKNLNKHLIHISTDFVFDGEKDESPYTEEDSPNPINWYGKTKLFGEENIVKSGCESTIIRLEMPFSVSYQNKIDIGRYFLKQLRQNTGVTAVYDQNITPVFVDDIAAVLIKCVKSTLTGTYHVVATTWVTPFEFAKLIAKKFNLNQNLIKPIPFTEYNNKPTRAKRPRNCWLNSEKIRKILGSNILHSVEESIEIFRDRQVS